VTNKWSAGDYKARKPSWRSASVEVYGAKVTEIHILNSSADARRAVSEALKKYYRYQGPWKFEEEIPF
jgi:hypothetical protein